MSDDQLEYCGICKQYPENILMLGCSHDLCLDCASKVFDSKENKYARENNGIQCQICSKVTQLDQSSIYELEKIAIQQKINETQLENVSFNNNNKNYNNNENLNNNNNNIYHVNQNLNKTSKSFNKYIHQQVTNTNIDEIQDDQYLKYQQNNQQLSNNNSNSKSIHSNNPSFHHSYNRPVLYCKEHSDEVISYFCFDCQGECICPECVIHGSHKNHDVQTIRKAYPQIRSQVEEHLDQQMHKENELVILRDKLIEKKKEIIDENKVTKKRFQEQFNDLRQELEEKEREILKMIDNSISKGLDDVEQKVRKNNEQIQIIQLDIKEAKDQLKQKDEMQLLQFYSQQLNSKNSYQKQIDFDKYFQYIKSIVSQSQTSKQSNEAFSNLYKSIQQIQNSIIQITTVNLIPNGEQLKTKTNNITINNNIKNKNI